MYAFPAKHLVKAAIWLICPSESATLIQKVFSPTYVIFDRRPVWFQFTELVPSSWPSGLIYSLVLVFFSMLWVLLLRHTRRLITTVEQVSCDITFKAGSSSLKNVVGPVWTEEAQQTNDGWWVSSQVSSLWRLPTRMDGLTAASKMLTIRYRR